MNFAVICDLELEFCLVPKEWVMEVICLSVLKYVSHCVEYSVELYDINTIPLYFDVTNYAFNLARKVFKDSESIEYEIRRLYISRLIKSQGRYQNDLLDAYKFCFGKQLNFITEPKL